MKLPSSSDWMPKFSEVRGLPGNYVRHWNAFDLTKIKAVEIKISSNEALNISDKITISVPFGVKKLEFFNKNLTTEKLPILDQMGQYVDDNWDGKLTNTIALKKLGNEDFKNYKNISFASELSKYGGFNKGIKKEATGFFYTTKHEGMVVC